jgi:hypothetical protein
VSPRIHQLHAQHRKQQQASTNLHSSIKRFSSSHFHGAIPAAITYDGHMHNLQQTDQHHGHRQPNVHTLHTYLLRPLPRLPRRHLLRPLGLRPILAPPPALQHLLSALWHRLLPQLRHRAEPRVLAARPAAHQATRLRRLDYELAVVQLFNQLPVHSRKRMVPAAATQLCGFSDSDYA